MTLTWQVFSQSGEILFATSKLEPPGAWWPTLYFCLHQIVPAARSLPPNEVRSYGFYSCPKTNKTSWCGGGQKDTFAMIGVVLLHLCNNTHKSPRTRSTYYLSPGPNRWWACSTRLTPCVSTSVFNDTRDYYILV